MDARSAVLCHCLVGMSRSVTVVIAYLMLMKGMTLRDAAGLVKDKRPIAYPNLGADH
jgi:protein-tyrosine phosphatase